MPSKRRGCVGQYDDEYDSEYDSEYDHEYVGLCVRLQVRLRTLTVHWSNDPAKQSVRGRVGGHGEKASPGKNSRPPGQNASRCPARIAQRSSTDFGGRMAEQPPHDRREVRSESDGATLVLHGSRDVLATALRDVLATALLLSLSPQQCCRLADDAPRDVLATAVLLSLSPQ